MISSMDLELSEDQEFLAGTTRRFLEAEAPVSAIRAARHDAAGFDREYWRRGAELGWTSPLVTEENGGGSVSGRPLADLALIAFAFGHHAAPGPLVPANVVAAVLSRVGVTGETSRTLARLISGDLIGTWAYLEPRTRFGDINASVTRTSAGVRIVGAKAPVESAQSADVLLVTGRSGDGLTQVLVPAEAEGVTITPMTSIDLTRRFGNVVFDIELPERAVVGEFGAAAEQVEWQGQVAIALELAQMVGAMDRAFAMTLEWAFDRYSFGRPLASYQELKHRFADMKLWLEASHAITDMAVRAADDGAEDAAELISAAKAYVSHYGPELMHDCVQIHGGIGVTFEHDLHLYLRRVVLGSKLHGSAADHRERLTVLLERLGEAA
jgi:alkylation response protein AidB-like acyl-CoA dehydrogenase